jgi:hypothetical protein
MHHVLHGLPLCPPNRLIAMDAQMKEPPCVTFEDSENQTIMRLQRVRCARRHVVKLDIQAGGDLSDGQRVV